MDLFVVSPRAEGFSLALQEIVRHKKPVVCSNIPIFKELFTVQEVRFFSLDDIDGLVEAIRSLAEGKDKNILIENAYAKFLSTYTTDKMGENYLSVYQDLHKWK
jgi:glycosyltransferase involved in cell wall biosynthesis